MVKFTASYIICRINISTFQVIKYQGSSYINYRDLGLFLE
jgi:hypothetical protein